MYRLILNFEGSNVPTLIDVETKDGVNAAVIKALTGKGDNLCSFILYKVEKA